MSYKIVDENSIISLADAIRLKGGTSASLVFPSGFVSAIENISGGYTADDIAMRTQIISGSINGNAEFLCSFAFANCSYLTSVNFPNCSEIGSYAFQYCQNLTTVNFPNCNFIEWSAFYYCDNLITISFPNCSYIGLEAFYNCEKIVSMNLPKCSFIGESAFYWCERLTTASFLSCASIGSGAFGKCYRLLSLYLSGSSVAILANTDAFISTPISNYTTATDGVYGSIYVPTSLYNSYITATNWSVYSARIVSV